MPARTQKPSRDRQVRALRLLAPAKVNLCLYVGAQRPDGYHELVTLMQPLDLGDELEIRPGGRGLHITCSDPSLANDDNLVIKAARAWFQAAGLPEGASFHLEKKVPVAAGLGGGSSDAATALLGLNALFGAPLAVEDIFKLARGLGADVPFFLAGETCQCRGIGDIIEPWPDFPGLNYVLVNPGVAVSTAQVYAEYDLTWTNRRACHKIYRSNRNNTPWEWLLVNDLESVTMKAHPELGDIKSALSASGAQGVLMSGSGPSVFGVFDKNSQARRAAEELSGQGSWWVRACQGAGTEQ